MLVFEVILKILTDDDLNNNILMQNKGIQKLIIVLNAIAFYFELKKGNIITRRIQRTSLWPTG